MKISEIKRMTEGIDEKLLDLIDYKIESEMEKALKEIRIVYWVVGIVGTVISVLLAIIALK